MRGGFSERKNNPFPLARSRLDESDVVLFHMRDAYTPPARRLPHQWWVFAVMEPPAYDDPGVVRAARGRFNLTMTYKLASDVYWGYGECAPREAAAPPTAPRRNYAAGKRHLVAWFASNCETPSGREAYVRELRRHVDVHVYGACGERTCSRADMGACYAMLHKRYKFYLSFESSLCDDYVTEKLFSVLGRDVVPVVRGRADYRALLPPHSVIDTAHFRSPRALAAHLRMLDADDRKYNEYFRWRETHACREVPIPCRVCEYALKNRGQKRVVADIERFWGPETNCDPARYEPADGTLRRVMRRFGFAWRPTV